MTTDEEHVEAMKKLKTEQREKRLASKKLDRGLILVHTGNGKGKSSSAFGVIVRALGWGHQVGLVQYIKGTWKTGERNFFDQFRDSLTWHTMGEGFTWETQDRQRDIEAAKAALKTSAELLQSGDFDLVVLDEINIVLRYDYLAMEEVLDVLASRADRTSVILTGRDARPELIEAADLVTEMKEIKHPYQQGIKAKQGIDF
ncbi:MAG: cob(I)yrinic acid a,c-diamide adenosyltransferase [Gammaproteobacteria bacterium]|jgi:cob(I)alamin adenosyltransferase|nr:cob(I)yrinic acid a,c-diamide adenosyltransferase [Gammaproteobacteria bacterium]MBT4491774.1 cob(I)yrinic acid a,c-diamide adenosyltransferase [Gammaproteobacteria bacterium]MBT7370285.1 cob(I)yrinic acid a,c-diamide adenosyltransferase [Gammaproteobacteria bacterium]